MTTTFARMTAVGIGEKKAAHQLCDFTGLPPSRLRVDPGGDLHRNLDVNCGPVFSIPDGVSDGVLECFLRQLPGGIPAEEGQLRPVATEWLNYLAMCASVGAPGTLAEILREYFGDKSLPKHFRDDDVVEAGFLTTGSGVGPTRIGPLRHRQSSPERFRDDDAVEAGFLTIGPGVGPTRIGLLRHRKWFADEQGYRRPVELATVRLKNMVKVLTRWEEYVSNPMAIISLRGATYLFDEGGRGELYSYKSRGVLTYSETMARLLSFLDPYIGEDVARNPLGLKDNGGGELVRGTVVLKPAGKAMRHLSSLFKIESFH